MSSNRISSSSGVTRALAHRARRNFPLAAIVVVLLFAAGTLAAAKPTPTPTPVLTATPTPTPTPAGLAGKISWSCNHGNICLFDLTSGLNTDTGVSGVNSKLSPNGTRIAFQGSGGIGVMNADGTNPTFISSFGGVPAWSPDGTKIAFASNGIWVMNADGSQPHKVTTFGIFPAWSPDMTEIAFSSADTSVPDLWTMNPDGTNAHVVSPGYDLDVVWSPSSRILVGGNVDKTFGYEIFAFDPVTSSLNRLTTSPGSDFEPAASPDGSKIAFSSSRRPAGIYIMNADGSSPRLIISGGRQPSWGP